MDQVEVYSGYVQENTSYVEVKEPKLVECKVASGTYAYLIRILQLGALEGALGETDINLSLKPLIKAMHHVFAGGEIEIKIIQEGNLGIVKELDNRLEQGRGEANTLNKKAGYRLLPWT
jgi:hypothetical protein